MTGEPWNEFETEVLRLEGEAGFRHVPSSDLNHLNFFGQSNPLKQYLQTANRL